uniref:Putative Fe-S oxidoreductase n=1 Tax=Streptomyces ribosidificus TaxID=80859 RepID=Q2MFC1_STRRI|nr:putative Fe-S oxidoreductase [Streptomyces ribosidificus]
MASDIVWPPPVHQVHAYRNIVVDGSCNIRCSCCEVRKTKVDQIATIRSLDRIFAEYEPDTALFRVESDGEITRYPKIVDHLQKRATEGYRIEVLSNGTKLPRALEGHSGLLWVFSVDGRTEAVNSKRGVRREQVDRILDAAVELKAEPQTVYWGHPVEKANAYIDHLKARNYQRLLHFVQLLAFKWAAADGKPVPREPAPGGLPGPAGVLPPLEPRLRDRRAGCGLRPDHQWLQLPGVRGRDPDGQVRLLLGAQAPGARLGPIREFDNWLCGTFIANQELNNSRERMRVPQGRVPLPIV